MTTAFDPRLDTAPSAATTASVSPKPTRPPTASPRPSPSRPTAKRGWWLAVPLGLLAVVVYVALKLSFARIGGHSAFTVFYATLVTVFVVSRCAAGLTFRGPQTFPASLPRLSIIVPVKNEGLMIGNTIKRLFESGYPADLIEVMVVDDGSTDATAAALGVARHLYPQLRVITLPKNVGKRRAMAEGIREATGDAFVMIDSDTLIVPGALNRIATALSDPAVGAVSGTTIILNEQVNTLTRAQSLIYEISFRVHKSAEARFGAVSCCPGCFSVYRREAVLPLLERWRDETFLGQHTIFGDDRALTMLLLRDGWKNTFQPDAVARTAVPEHVRGYLRQQLRWKKSWLQQGVRASMFMWRQHPVAAVWFYLGLFLSLVGPVFAFRALVVDPLALGAIPWRYIIGAACVSIAIASYLAVLKRDASRLTAVLILPLIAVVLAFQMPLAIARLSDARWGTR